MRKSLPSDSETCPAADDRARIRLDGVSLRFILYGTKRTGMKEALFSRLFHRHVRRLRETKQFWVLQGIDLTVSHGERLGVIGVNGAGKTTLLQVIAGIYPPTSGRVEIDGRVAPLIDIGAGFSAELTGRENIFLYSSLLGRASSEMAGKVDRILEFAELQDFADMPIKYYSTGMRQRLNFSVATEVVPEILLIDEVFAAGDAFFTLKAKDRMHMLLDNSKISVMVSHNLGLIREACSRVILIHQGKIARDGEPDAVCAYYLESQGR